MNYPNITLHITNGKAEIQLHNSEDNSRVMVVGQNVNEYLEGVLERLKYSEGLQEAYNLAIESDELFIDFPDMTQPALVDRFDFRWLDKFIDQQISEFTKPEHESSELNAQLLEFWQGDVIASVIDRLYQYLVLNTVMAASEIGTGNIVLVEDTGNPRLRELMSKELQKFDVELVISE